ncbi:SDR family oxidoreductase [Sphingomonas melonis]|uniref:Uncharacterized protein YbjT (DUF2867 family) n=1 Tax=Sphingomonas melonis TaxID=152682 RepID=A0A7Y9FLB2_9SPHN|nr:hypothetical protein [Sphingomonas melonis]NYD89203.1 uncharacterized protein YbjT (DUF2867 family) [Sphingomonas melonis]
MTRNVEKAEPFRALRAKVAVADVHDVQAMRNVFRTGKRLFLLNPPAVPATDTDHAEKETVRQLLAALDGSGLEMIVAQSTYGAQPGDQLGDLNTLYELEQGLAAQSIPYSIIRAAYYMSNWDMVAEPARQDGIVPTMSPANLTTRCRSSAARTISRTCDAMPWGSTTRVSTSCSGAVWSAAPGRSVRSWSKDRSSISASATRPTGRPATARSTPPASG